VRGALSVVLVAVLVAALLCGLAVVAMFVWLASLTVPTPAEIRARHLPSTASLLSREGVVMQTVRINSEVQRDAWVDLADVSAPVKAMVLLAEDRNFYSHGTVDWRAVAASLWRNATGDRRRGASTLSMQTADLLSGYPKGRGSRTWLSKLRQWGIAVRLERSWGKDAIFEAYLNELYFRGELQGIGAASRFLFGRSPDRLGREEGALLAVLIRAPGAPVPVVVRRFTALMAAAGTPVPEAQAQRMVLTGLYRKAGYGQTHEAPHLARLLQQALAAGAATPTTLAADLQRAVNRLRDARLRELRGRNVSDAGVVVLDNASGQVLAYAGTSPALSLTPYVDTVLAVRQAGSTLKPFIYGYAIETRRLTAASLIVDEPLAEFSGSGVYAPQNYDRRYRGAVSVRTALASSLNVPAVKALRIAGEEAVSQRLAELGLAVPQEADFYGEGLALGSLDVNLMALTGAYRVLAHAGLGGAPCFRGGCAAEERRIMPPSVAWLIGDLLSDNNARAATFGLHSVLRAPYWTAVKTGTSKDMRDNWALGFSAAYTVGVWVGNADGEPMHDVSGVSGAAPLWRDIMDYLHRSEASVEPPPPAGVVRAETAGGAGGRRAEFFLAGTEQPVIRAVSAGERAAAGQLAIVNPVPGSVLALDPDIPAGHQLVELKANVTAALHWRVDGRTLSGARWAPAAGRHHIELLDERGTLQASATVLVRGGR